mgnify:CR=1 FL=1
MMAFKDRLRQIIKLPLAHLTLIPLAVFLLGMKSPLRDVGRPTRWTPHTFRPTQLPDHFIALGIVHQILDMDQHGAPPNRDFELFYINLLETS